MHIPIFLVFYSTTFTILLLALIGFLLISPADAIYQSLQNTQPANVIIVAAAYLLTLLAAGFIYATRLYATRTHLAALPRSARIPELLAGTAVRRVVAAGLARAAAIAYAAHPRDLVAECNANGGQPPPPPPELGAPGNESPTVREANRQLPKPAFGVIQHPGWTAPSATDLPGVHFPPVITELPHLLEAKAVSLAPPEAFTPHIPPAAGEAAKQGSGNVISLPDHFAVAMLQRPASMDTRSYVARLDTLGAITDAEAAASFVNQYEYARFSGKLLDEDGFRRLMTTFAALLRGLQAPDRDVLRDLANFSTSSETASMTPSVSSGRSAAPSTYSQHSTQGFRHERPTIPKRSNTAGSASAILERLTAQDQAFRSKRPAGSRQTTSRSTGAPGSAASPAASTPLPTTPTPHQTPFFTPYRTSVSSNDGDRSADTSDAEPSSGADEQRADATARDSVAGSSHHRRSLRPTPSRRSTHSSSARLRHARGLGLAMTRLRTSSPSPSTEDATFMSFTSDGEEEADDDDGSVIRRVVTAREVRWDSGSEGGSVVIRPESHNMGGMLPVSVPVVGDGADGAGDIAEMRMVEGRGET